MSKQVYVTQEDIDHAKRGSYHCPIADAVVRQIPGATRGMADIQSIRYTIGDRRYVHMTPRMAWEFLVAFDAEEPVKPFRFSLQNPVWKGDRVHARGTTGYTPVSDEEQNAIEEQHGVARIHVGTNTKEGRRTGKTLSIPTSAPPARPTRASRYGLFGLAVNKGRRHAS